MKHLGGGGGGRGVRMLVLAGYLDADGLDGQQEGIE